MNINFKVSKKFLIAQIINSLDNSLLSNDELEKLSYQIYDLKFPDHLKSKVVEVESSEKFKSMYKDNILYMENVRNYYLENKVFIDEYLKKVLKLDLDNIEMTAYIIHPFFGFGIKIDNNSFIFGSFKGLRDKNYDLSYLIHESLHHILSGKDFGYAYKIYKKFKGDGWNEYWDSLSSEEKEKFNKDWDNEKNGIILHSIIELIADNELYTILDGESKYNAGHEERIDDRKELYSRWFAYLGLNQNEILKRIGTDINMEDFDYERIKSAKDIREFIDICIEDLTLDSVNVVNKL